MPKHSRWNILGRKENETYLQKVEDRRLSSLISLNDLFSMDEVQRIREIQVLKLLNGHPNIIFLREIIL